MTTARRPAISGLSAWMRRAWPSRHLTDRELLETVVDAGTDDRAARSPAAAHAAGCALCAARREQLRSALGRLSDAAEAAFEVAVTPARLTIQRRRIQRRIEHAAAPPGAARLLRFPAAAAPAWAGATPARRWFAAALAAGFIVGALAVGSLDIARNLPAGESPAPSVPLLTPAANTASPGAVADEELMRDLEEALAAPGISPLATLDAMTPRLREVAIDIR